MRYKNESQLNLRFLKTLALAANRLASSGKSEDVGIFDYSEYVKTASRIFPVLENMAWKLNVQYGSDIKIPDTDGLDDYGRSLAFADLSHSLFEETEKRFPNIKPWYDGNFNSFPQQLNAAVVNASNSQNKYWLYHALGASYREIELKKSESRQQMHDEIERIKLSERVVDIMEHHGLTVNEVQSDNLDNILCDVGYEFLSAKKRIDSGELTVSLRDRLQENWEIFDDDDELLLSLMEPMEILGQVVRRQQKNFYGWNRSSRYLNEIRGCLTDVPNDEQIWGEISPLVAETGKMPAKTWADGKEMPDYLDGYDDDNIQRLNTESLFWKNYEAAGAVFHTSEWRERTGLILAGWAQMLWDETGDIDDRLSNFWKENFDIADDEEDDDENDVSEENADGENAQIFKDDMLFYGERFLVLAEAAEKYMGIVLNDSGVSQTTLDAIAEENGLSRASFRVFDLIVDAFDNNYEAKDFLMSQTVLDEDEDARVFIDKLSKLPHSPEKREIANLMLRSFRDQEQDLTSEEEIITDDFVEQIEIIQQKQYETLEDFTTYAVGAFPELSAETADSLADRLSYAVSANFVIPLYLDIKPHPEAKEKILEELDGYEEYSPAARKYMSGLIDGYFKAIKPFHEENKVYLEAMYPEDEWDDCNEPMVRAIVEYKDIMLRSTDLKEQINQLQDISQEEESVYRKYAKFQEKRDSYHISDKDMLRMLVQSKAFLR